MAPTLSMSLHFAYCPSTSRNLTWFLNSLNVSCKFNDSQLKLGLLTGMDGGAGSPILVDCVVLKWFPVDTVKCPSIYPPMCFTFCSLIIASAFKIHAGACWWPSFILCHTYFFQLNSFFFHTKATANPSNIYSYGCRQDS